MNLEEAILDKVRRLPAGQQEQVLRYADGLQKGPLVRMVRSRDRRREMDWIKENRARYAINGSWLTVSAWLPPVRTGIKCLPPPKLRVLTSLSSFTCCPTTHYRHRGSST